MFVYINGLVKVRMESEELTCENWDFNLQVLVIVLDGFFSKEILAKEINEARDKIKVIASI